LFLASPSLFPAFPSLPPALLPAPPIISPNQVDVLSVTLKLYTNC
jgi:hypothetical protein